MYRNKLGIGVSGLLGLLTLGVSGAARAAWELNLPRGVTPISREVHDLHMLIFWICVAIGVLVFGVMFVAIVRHRKARRAQAAQFHHSTRAEIIWTIIPFVILVSMAIPATKALIFMEDTSGPDMTVKVTGYQWGWQYEYVDEGISFYSNLADTTRAAIYEDPTKVQNYLLEVDNDLVLPTGKKIRLLITAKDVIHAWWVPQLGQKKDAIPGYINELWTQIETPGVYRGQCAELCGAYHGFMPIVVEAKPEDEYQAWVAAQAEARAVGPARPSAEDDVRLAASPGNASAQ
ncbi:MAG: cytochrome c oxidase subunit II [Gammaproteobacteria bacterium]|nr:cytochrome c oxidase subunit II [Gammaproteobacteria bacterium]NIR82201.1 cytochrome c oxidase subunit II [Gammaproteobacteria bacterium]NIR90800.1 cytochrome c oxidase subunit II [Gammaproteobacteria bacterium]NIU03351.1 cytochrome c oxidase subunit II [Gammaproteobacteria bacterium]NIV50847.1 cytochrome c oxidase subunit II [Gammaproteobacteria bacterium]